MAWLTNFEKQRISTGRDWIDEYRADNQTRIAQGKGPTEKWNKLMVFYERMTTAGYEFDSVKEMVTYFFTMSKLMNVQEIGYETVEEFEANATAQERETYEGMWK